VQWYSYGGGVGAHPSLVLGICDSEFRTVYTSDLTVDFELAGGGEEVVLVGLYQHRGTLLPARSPLGVSLLDPPRGMVLHLLLEGLSTTTLELAIASSEDWRYGVDSYRGRLSLEDVRVEMVDAVVVQGGAVGAVWRGRSEGEFVIESSVDGTFVLGLNGGGALQVCAGGGALWLLTETAIEKINPRSGEIDSFGLPGRPLSAAGGEGAPIWVLLDSVGEDGGAPALAEFSAHGGGRVLAIEDISDPLDWEPLTIALQGERLLILCEGGRVLTSNEGLDGWEEFRLPGSFDWRYMCALGGDILVSDGTVLGLVDLEALTLADCADFESRGGVRGLSAILGNQQVLVRSRQSCGVLGVTSGRRLSPLRPLRKLRGGLTLK